MTGQMNLKQKPKEFIESGYPPQIYKFTGKYSEKIAGQANKSKAARNKKVTGYAPIYANEKGQIVVDMTQVLKEKPIQKYEHCPRISKGRGRISPKMPRLR
jgi:hypothetical protein